MQQFLKPIVTAVLAGRQMLDASQELLRNFIWSGGHDSLDWQSQLIKQLASWLGTHARRGSMSSC